MYTRVVASPGRLSRLTKPQVTDVFFVGSYRLLKNGLILCMMGILFSAVALGYGVLTCLLSPIRISRLFGRQTDQSN